MSRLKSLDELIKIREQAKEKIELRSTAEDENRVIIRVGMATCGIASGARETMNAILDEVEKQNLTNVSVTHTGCMGYCAEEPIVEVVSREMPSVLYGHVDAKRGREIVTEHIVNGRLVQNAIISKSFEKME